MKNRKQTPEEEVINAITHGIGILFGLFALPFLLEKASKLEKVGAEWAVICFGVGMLAVYISSTLYHAVQVPTLKNRLHICDHVSIFFLIGGSYMPFVLQYANPSTATFFLICQWTIIFIGAILKLFFTGKYENFSLFVYVFLGLSVVFLFPAFRQTMPYTVFHWIWIGGLSYITGVFFYRWEKQKYAHAVWHLLVLGGTVAHYIAIWKMYS